MFSISTLVLAFAAASASAHSVTSPSETKGWAPEGLQVLTWSRVSSDPSNFTVVLTNENRSVFPTNNQVLAALVDAETATSFSVSPPSGGWPVGEGFRVNLVKSSEELDSILAQSSEFDIEVDSASASVSASSVVRGATVIPNTARATGNGTPAGTGASDGILPGQTGAPQNQGAGSDASKTIVASSGLIAAFAIAAFLA